MQAEEGQQGHVARPAADRKGALEAVMARCSNGQRGRISGILLQGWEVSPGNRCQPVDAINNIGGNH